MLERNFIKVYNKFKLHLYSQILRDMNDMDDEPLSVQEVVYLELITVLRHPTINEFAHYAKLSGPNAAYRVNRLVNKGYIEKIQSERDKREYHLKPTPKYRKNYGSAYSYISVVVKRMKQRFEEEEIEQFDRMLAVVASELMPEMRSLNTNRFDPDEIEDTE
jgi:DNA-binding MarR family transcriptional regulator